MKIIDKYHHRHAYRFPVFMIACMYLFFVFRCIIAIVNIEFTPPLIVLVPLYSVCDEVIYKCDMYSSVMHMIISIHVYHIFHIFFMLLVYLTYISEIYKFAPWSYIRHWLVCFHTIARNVFISIGFENKKFIFIQEWNYDETKFPSNLYCDENFIEMVPWLRYDKIFLIWVLVAMVCCPTPHVVTGAEYIRHMVALGL